MTTLDVGFTTRTVQKPQVDYVMQWRELWADHVYWTRLTIEGIVDGVPGLEQTEARLTASCRAMIDLLRSYYGSPAAEEFGGLMMTHNELAAQLVTQASEGMADEADATEKAWYENADQIVACLSSMNPSLPKEWVATLLREHVQLTKNEAVARLGKDYDGDIATFNKVLRQTYLISDVLAHAVIKQFSSLFN